MQHLKNQPHKCLIDLKGGQDYSYNTQTMWYETDVQA